jgi:ankyrin repeat protein
MMIYFSLTRIKLDETALMTASYHGHERVVSLLIERGANIDIQNNVSI